MIHPFRGRGPLVRALVLLAGPIALQNLLGSLLNLADTVMIGVLGEAAIASVALANQVFFVLSLFCFAIGSGTAIFTAQYWGKADHASIRKALGLCLGAMEAGSMVFFLASQIAPEALLGFFSHDQAVIAGGTAYLRIMSWSFLANGLTQSLVNVLRSVEEVRLPLVAGVVSLAANTLLNALLINGLAGFPALGVQGAAIATVLSRLLETGLVIAGMTLLRPPVHLAVQVPGRRPGDPVRTRHLLLARLPDLWGFDRKYLVRFLKISLPVVGNEVGWALGYSVPALVFGRMGTSDLAAFNIADTAVRLAIVVFFGTTSANAILVGKRIGEGADDEARDIAGFFAVLAPLMGLVMGGVLACLGLVVPLAFQVSPEVRYHAMLGMCIFGLDMPVRMFNWHVIVGILRAGGDTRYSMVLDVGGTWLVSVPLTILAGLVLGLPFWMVYAATLVEDIPKLFMGMARLGSGKWLRDVTIETGAGSASSGSR